MIKRNRKKFSIFILLLIVILSSFNQPIQAAPPALGHLLNLSNNPETSRSPFQAVDQSGNSHVVWQDEIPPNQDDIFYRKVNANGTFGSLVINISNNSGLSTGHIARIDIANNIHIAWIDNSLGDLETLYRKINTDGTLSPILNLSSNPGNTVFSIPSIETDDTGNVHVVWADNSPGNSDVLYRKVNSDGTLGVQLNLSQSSGESNTTGLPFTGIDGSGNMHVVWSDKIGEDFEILYRKIDANESLGHVHNLSNNKGLSDFPFLRVDSLGNSHVVWRNERSAIPEGNTDILYKMIRSNGGLTPIINFSEGLPSSSSHFVALGGTSTVHVVWQGSDLTSLVDIFYRKTLAP